MTEQEITKKTEAGCCCPEETPMHIRIVQQFYKNYSFCFLLQVFFISCYLPSIFSKIKISNNICWSN